MRPAAGDHDVGGHHVAAGPPGEDVDVAGRAAHRAAAPAPRGPSGAAAGHGPGPLPPGRDRRGHLPPGPRPRRPRVAPGAAGRLCSLRGVTAVLGIDLGTQALTALAVDAATGRTLGVATTPLTMRAIPGGIRQQEPDEWWDAAVRA